MIPLRPLLALFALATWSVPRAVAEPKVEGDALLLPTYLFELQAPVSAGFAFVVDEGAQRYALTAYHVFGPAGGLRSIISPREMPLTVKAMAGICLGDGRTVVVAQPALYVEGARHVDEKGADGDVAIFRMTDPREKSALRLATVPSKVGDRVYLFARLQDRADAHLYPAKVTELTPRAFLYQFDDASLNLVACSGAPVLDEFGVVVAMHLGFEHKDLDQIGIGAPAAAIRDRLKAALAPRPPEPPPQPRKR